MTPRILFSRIAPPAESIVPSIELSFKNLIFRKEAICAECKNAQFT